ncbi:MinD/ParA family protein [Candidatus Marinimicrobia bacterium MT.SAG.4]|nr:MinD/ParA family protein [Candidatus Marinimicrobia bacterium MT.SAG.4]
MSRSIIWAVGGGKGGVGKTMFAANIAVGLAKFGKKVIVVDTDLGGANLHSYLGIKTPKVTINDFFLRKVSTLDELLLETSIDGLKILPGSNEIVGMANPRYFTKLKFMRHIQQLQADYVLLDVGAGTSYNTLDLFSMAHTGIVVTIPEKPAIESAYGFIKASIYRKLLTVFQKDLKMHDLIDQARNPTNDEGIKSVHELLLKAKEISPESAAELEATIDAIDLRIVVNFVQNSHEEAIGPKMVELVERYLTISPEYIGSIPFSGKVRESLTKQTTLLMEDNEDEASAALVFAARKLTVPREFQIDSKAEEIEKEDLTEPSVAESNSEK